MGNSSYHGSSYVPKAGKKERPRKIDVKIDFANLTKSR
jgi:hypothetical protein